MHDDNYIALAATDPSRCGISVDVCLTKAESKNITKYLREADKRIKKRIKVMKFKNHITAVNKRKENV